MSRLRVNAFDVSADWFIPTLTLQREVIAPTAPPISRSALRISIDACRATQVKSR
jgi:hypothetical protein